MCYLLIADRNRKGVEIFMHRTFWKKLLLVLLGAVFLEVFYFNWGTVQNNLLPEDEKNIVLTMNDWDFYNWSIYDSTYTSNLDPSIVKTNLNVDINNIEIQYLPAQTIGDVSVFYTEEAGQIVNADRMLVFSEIESKQKLPINKHVVDLRIDLGEQAGLKLNEITVVLNPTEWNISIYRIATVLMIYVFSILLFRLQESPNYDI